MARVHNASSLQAGFTTKMLLLLIAGGFLMLAAGGTTMYFVLQQQKSSVLGSSAKAEKESAELIAEVSKLIELPKGEEPTIATVSDINKLKGQEFFAQAKNGDKVLIYTKAQKAILYDPIAKKVVEVGPINMTQPTQAPAASDSAKPAAKATGAPTPTQKPVSVAIYNGTTVAGYANTMGNQLQTSVPNVTVTGRQNASKATYTKTVVVDLTGKQKTAAAQVAKALGGSVGALPAGEAKPVGADLLVVLGR